MADDKRDNVTDLTGDSEEAGNGKVKKKNEKKGKEPAPNDAKEGKAGKKGGKADKDQGGKNKINGGKKQDKAAKKKGGKLKLVFILAAVAIVVLCATALILNLFGARDIAGRLLKEPFIAVVTWLDPEFTSVQRELRDKHEKREAVLDKREAELDVREMELNRRTTELETRIVDTTEWEAALEKRSSNLDKREESLKQAQATDNAPALERVLTDEELANLQSLSRSYANMTPAAAAEILAELYIPEDAALIIYHMSERKAAAILEAMDINLAARITEILLAAS